MRQLITSIFILTVLIYCSATSQNYTQTPWQTRSAWGLFGNADFNLHSASFKGFAGVPSCCPEYESGSGIRFSGGLFYTLPLADRWELSLRAIYSDLSGTLTRTEPMYVAGLDGKGVNGEFEHSIKASIASVGLSPLVGLRLSDPLTLNFGLRAGYVLSKTYDQKEEITSPSFGVFQENGQRVRNASKGDIPNASAIEAAAVLGLSYSLPLNDAFTWFLVPEAYFTYGITPVASDLTWRIATINGGLALKYAPRKIKPPKPPSVPPPAPPMPSMPPPPSMPMLDASILAVGVNPDGSESNVSQLRIEEFLSQKMHPVLNYIFFDENSAEIPARYKKMDEQEKKAFSVKFLYNLNTMDVYHYVLNVVGRRMVQYPQSEVTLVGCNSDEGVEKGNTALSQKRATAVKDYLDNVWKISDSRVKVQARNLPQNPSNLKDADGIVENRRVEIIANVPEIFEPLIVRDTLREANPPVFRFKPKVNAQIGIDEWKIITAQSSGDLKTFSGKGEPPTVLEWDLSKEALIVPRFSEPLLYRMDVVDRDNKRWASPTQELPVEQMTIEKKMMEQIADKEIDRFSLILFGFDKSDLGAENLKIIEYAKKRIRPRSTVTIFGFSDRVGETQHNQDLSTRRAISAAKALGVDPKFSKGFGESKLLFDNELPEGRFYCRTVNIEIITPIDNK